MHRIDRTANHPMAIAFIVVFSAFFSTLFANNPVQSPRSFDAPLSQGAEKQAEAPTEVVVTHRQSDSAVTIDLVLKMRDGVYMYASQENFFKLDVSGTNIGEPKISYPSTEEIENFDGKRVGIYRTGKKITVRVPILSDEWKINGSLRYQACDSIQCFLPQTVSFEHPKGAEQPADGGLSPSETSRPGAPLLEQLGDFKTIGSEGGYLKSESFLSFLENPAGTGKGAFADKSLWLIIFLILVGGIALNLTPCVLPMIPVTLAIIGAGSQARSRSHGFLVGGVYGAAMAVTYGILGLVVVLTGTQFGTLNANPIFNFAIAGLFVVLALAMFDIIHIDFTKYRNRMKQKGSAKGELLPVFFMGVVAALLAGACVAPVVISVVLYAATLYGEGALLGLSLPFLLGIGMALPWPFAGAGISFMPKPGNWMITVRNIFGVFILATALYYGYTGAKTVMATKSAEQESAAKSSVTSKIDWHYSLKEALRESERTNTPVVIDFWATWCKNCAVMDKTTFQDDAVAAKMNGSYIPVKFQAETPNDPATKELLDHFSIVGLPSYIILEPK